MEYPLIFLAGLAGSWHCVGMCGGFACALGWDGPGHPAGLMRQYVYNLGRVTSYCFIGALAGYLAAGLCTSEGATLATTDAQRVLAVASGILMVFIGLQFLGLIRRRHGAALVGVGGQLMAGPLRGVLRAPGPAAPLAFGVFNGFLPCPLVYAFAAQAAASGGPLPGLLVMLSFGLGTFPAMLLTGMFAQQLYRSQGGAGGHVARWRQRSVDFAGAFIVFLGVITLARGVVPVTGHLHLP